MLREILKTSIRRMLPRADDASAPQATFPVDELRALKALHERSPLEMHRQILYGDARIEGMGVLDLFNSCVSDTGTLVSPWKALTRIQGVANLARYFLHSLALEGARAECGVFQGLSALLACRAARSKFGEYAGRDFHLIDSFEGFPQPGPEDFISVKVGDQTGTKPAFNKGDGAASFDHVRALFRDFPGVTFHRGFIPGVLNELPETRWAFVHVDVDLYQPTLESLEYFYPRMTTGGIIVCDDYGSKLFPGARKAWEGYCASKGVAFVVLDTGQSVLVK